MPMGQMSARVTLLQDREGRIVKELTHRTPVTQADQQVIDVAHAGGWTIFLKKVASVPMEEDKPSGYCDPFPTGTQAASW